MSPKRIRMTRQKPWRADNPDAVVVARPSKWGNPFRFYATGTIPHEGKTVQVYRIHKGNSGMDALDIGIDMTLEHAHTRAVEFFRIWMELTPEIDPAELRGLALRAAR